MTLSELIFVVSFLALVCFLRAALRAWHDPATQRDLARLREQRRLRKAARR
jgi:hypothetical protein